MEFVDTHAHVYLDQFDEDIGQVIQRAESSGISKIYLPNIDKHSVSAMLELEDRYPGHCYPMIGLHPCSVAKDFERDLKEIEGWLHRRSFKGIGETGTDMYWEESFKEQQVESLRIQIGWAKKFQLPIILHSRNSLDLTIETIERNHSEDLTGIFHCFAGNLDQAGRIADLGFYIGVGGVVTFKNSNLSEILEQVSLSRVVLETDSPYLAPVPYRGKRNEPSYIPMIAERLAEVYTTDIENIAKTTTDNARKIFREA